jgi:ribosomal protein RSM22 (predicted rRNA methylase)
VPGLPTALAAALAARAEGRSRRELGERLARISERYRGQGTSEAIVDAADALAYALARMPATYAAIARVLDELTDRAPGWTPGSILDAGAGPGTATWAARELWPGADATLLDRNRALLSLAEGFSADRVRTVGASFGAAGIGRADLVLAGYALTEVADAELGAVAAWLWAVTKGALVVVEPGTPRDYQRLMGVRAALIGAGAELLAPCAHECACPLVAPDWCHFAVRVERSRDHRVLKAADAPFEDEKFSYLVMARPGVGAKAAGRLIKPVRRSKYDATLEVCGPVGIETRVVAKRDKGGFRGVRHVEWGDTV